MTANTSHSSNYYTTTWATHQKMTKTRKWLNYPSAETNLNILNIFDISPSLKASESQRPTSMYHLSVFITPSSSLRTPSRETVKIKHTWPCFLEMQYLPGLNLVWCMCESCVYKRGHRDRECVLDEFISSTLSSSPLPWNKNKSWGCFQEKRQAKPAVG